MGTLKNPVKVMRKAIKHAGRDAKRPIMCSVHLDECGDVVSTDSYRLCVQHDAWEGGSVNIDFATAYDISKCKVKGNETAAFTFDVGKVIVRMGDGTEIIGALAEGKYPNYKSFTDVELLTVAYAKTDELLSKAREFAKAKRNDIALQVKDREVTFGGEWFEGAFADGGDMVIGMNPAYARDALMAIDDKTVAIGMKNPLKPAIFTGDSDKSTEVIVMPIRLDEPATKKGASVKKPKKKEGVNKEGLAELLYALAIDRAAKEPDNRLTEGNASPGSAEYVWRLQKEERLKNETFGDYTSWYLDGDFIVCVERRWSQRKVHLHYPEIKPKRHDTDEVMRKRTEKALKEREVEAEVKVDDDGGVTAIEITPKQFECEQFGTVLRKEGKVLCKRYGTWTNCLELGRCTLEGREVAKREDGGMKELEARLAELEKELASAKATAKMWEKKAEEYYSAKDENVEQAAVVSLTELCKELQDGWCKEHPNTCATYIPKDGACVKVHGVLKEHEEWQKELTEMGFRFAKKGFWYYGEKEARRQGKKAVIA